MFHKVAQGVVMPNVTLSDKAVIDAMMYVTDLPTWRLDDRSTFVVCRVVNVERAIMQPNYVPIPHHKAGTVPIDDKHGRTLVKDALATIKPVQYWPSDGEHRELVGRLQALTPHALTCSWCHHVFVTNCSA